VMDLVAVFALFVFMLSLLCFCVLPFSSVNKDLYIIIIIMSFFCVCVTVGPVVRGDRRPPSAGRAGPRQRVAPRHRSRPRRVDL